MLRLEIPDDIVIRAVTDAVRDQLDPNELAKSGNACLCLVSSAGLKCHALQNQPNNWNWNVPLHTFQKFPLALIFQHAVDGKHLADLFNQMGNF